MLGINKETPEIEGGKIDRDQEGKPTGILRELALDKYKGDGREGR